MITRHGAEVLDELRPLYLGLRDHHAAAAPHFGAIRDDDGAWARRIARYRRAIAEEDGFVLVARGEHGNAVGYAFTHLADGMPGWTQPERLGVVDTLTVDAQHRGKGIGTALLARVYDELAPLGIDTVALDVIASNEGARRFYEREGFTERTVTYWARRP